MHKGMRPPLKRALSIRQPYAELILRGLKKVEYRSRPTLNVRDEFYIYAAIKPGEPEGFRELDCLPSDLPTGVLVGTARISHCTKGAKGYEWHLTDVHRLQTPKEPQGQPQPVWFNPFPDGKNGKKNK
jgi:hypothetical protein